MTSHHRFGFGFGFARFALFLLTGLLATPVFAETSLVPKNCAAAVLNAAADHFKGSVSEEVFKSGRIAAAYGTSTATDYTVEITSTDEDGAVACRDYRVYIRLGRQCENLAPIRDNFSSACNPTGQSAGSPDSGSKGD